jgi:hypothetical protein
VLGDARVRVQDRGPQFEDDDGNRFFVRHLDRSIRSTGGYAGGMTDFEDQDARPEGDPTQDHPAQEAHGGSMAPGLVDDTGHPIADVPDESPDETPA